MPALIFLLGLFLYIYAEIWLLISIGSQIGILSLIVLMIGISLCGWWLIQSRGIMTITLIRRELAQGKVPTQAVISSLFFVMAGILLLIPGFISDIVAIVLMLPITRAILPAMILKLLTNKIQMFSFSQYFNRSSSTHNAQTFEAEFERKADEDKWLK